MQEEFLGRPMLITSGRAPMHMGSVNMMLVDAGCLRRLLDLWQPIKDVWASVGNTPAAAMDDNSTVCNHACGCNLCLEGRCPV
jgi:hypothetical protein